jgi:diaminopimelate epimerase
MEFVKMHGNGNDFIVIEDLKNEFVGKESSLAAELCHRNFGIGGDGILLVRKSDKADIKMEIINSDGSYASMCGNGVRCFAKYVWDKGIIKKNIVEVETGDGVKTAYLTIEENTVKSVMIYMGMPIFEPKSIPALSEDEIVDKKITVKDKVYNITTMLLGVPHTVIIGKLDTFNVEEGKPIEHDSRFPQRTNVNFCEIIDKENVHVKTWERGAGATLACGTGTCASVVAANKLGYVGKAVNAKLPGGHLFIEIKDDGVYMTGPAVTVFEGTYLLK